MSVAERPVPPPGGRSSLTGWGGTATSRSRVLQARDPLDVVRIVASHGDRGTGLIARGAGRSYGDAALNDGGDVIDMTGCNRIVSIDRERGTCVAQAGVTVAQLQAALARERLTLPVVPGTGQVTIGGAIASDVHGKNHHRDGALARHVSEISLCTPAAGLLELSPQDDPDMFYATLGGMGLTGVVAQATLRVEPLASGWVAEDVDRTDDLDQTLATIAADDGRRYSVAWLDLLAPGARCGRAVISRADPLAADAVPRTARRDDARALERRVRPGRTLGVPRGIPSLLSPGRVRELNALRWRRSPRHARGRPQTLARYLFPLDSLERWNRLYGPAGLIQYQFVVPDGQEAALLGCFQIIRERRLPVYLAVFKRFGPAFGGPLSFPLAGWTLAIDLPAATPGLPRALDELDELVAGCGGRVYLTKDVRMREESVRAMYPLLDHFHAQRMRADPGGMLRSDLARRLALC
ncbi:MAG: decaprenylphospho-beta-D-ribofuranose 2-oxidase [Solirubrobacteraceae bacterium]|jgi:decaprenylphospho-beta-D-ribofuranose 2-oxidase|nr:decaprenylphospho-beta-D-ribofuranose 2-oxidase [Solirubrobacteraceae bacterium]